MFCGPCTFVCVFVCVMPFDVGAMSNVPKIIIKPRLIVPAPQQQPISAVPTPSSRAEDDDEDNEAVEEDEREDDNMDLDDSQVAAGTVDDDTELGTPGPKGKGKSRGRTKGAVTATPTKPKPKARAKGKTKGVMKTAGGLTIKLPKRGEEDGEGGAGEGVEGEEAETDVKEPDVKEGTPAVAEVDEGPIGGGKPFRRIQDKVYVIDGDEYVTEDDPKGDEKIDKWGNLLGGTRLTRPCLHVKVHIPLRSPVQGIYIYSAQQTSSAKIYARHRRGSHVRLS